MEMIHPTSLVNLKSQLETSRGFFLFCFLGILLCLVNFAPVLEAHTTGSKHLKVYNSLRFWFGNCFFFSLPLWIEFCIDVYLKRLYTTTLPAKQRTSFDYDFGHTALLMSLTLPLYLFVQPDEEAKSLLFTECYIAACRTLALVAIFGKLQVFSAGHWNVCNCIPMITSIVFVEVLNSFGLSRCGTDANCEMKLEFNPQIYMAFCIVLNTFFARRYFYEYYKLRFTKEGSAFFDVSRCASLCLILIVQGYLVTRFIMAFIVDGLNVDRNFVLAYKVLMLIILATLAAILPGRMVRRMLITVKSEMAHKETFVRYISHEIRSPLSTATLGLDYLIKQLSAGEQMDMTSILDVVRDVRYSTETATNTLNDLLMFNKIKSGMLELATEKCDLWAFVQQSVTPFSIQIHCNHFSFSRRRVHLTYITYFYQALSANVALNWRLQANLPSPSTNEPHQKLPTDIESQEPQQPQQPTDNAKVSAIMVRIDKYKMEQVIRNFMTNALKFTPSGGSISVNVTLRSEYSKPIQPELNRPVDRVASNILARLEVVDTGPGIHETNLPKLFGQYVQFDANTLQGGKGSGLGLWLSKAIVEMHGGLIGATSEGVGHGCTFFLELPVTDIIVHDDDDEGDDDGGGNDKNSIGKVVTNITSFNSYETSNSQSSGLAVLVNDNQLRVVTDKRSSTDDCKMGGSDPQLTIAMPRTNMETTPLSSSAARPPVGQRQLQRGASWISSTSSAAASSQRSSSKTPHSPHRFQQLNGILSGKGIAPKVALITRRAKVYQSLAEGEPPEMEQPLRPLRVLIVDDSQLARKMVTRTLSALEGCVCEHASNGKEAVDKVMASQSDYMHDDEDGEQQQQQPFDVILMDFYMPVMNGPDAVRTLRSPLCDYTGLILAVTGVSAESEFDSLLEAGLIDHILVKPFDLAVFKRVVKTHDKA